MDKKQKKILIIAGAAVAAFILTIVWLFASGAVNGSTSVTLKVSPVDAAITLDGKKISSGKITIPNGKHTIAGTRKDFTKATLDIDTDNITPDQNLYLILGADSDTAKQYLSEHPDEVDIREGASGDDFNKTQDTLQDKYAFVQYLPYENLDFTIDYSVNDDKSVNLDVTLKPITDPALKDEYKGELQDLKKTALQWMKDHGVDTDKTTISWSPDPDQ